MFIAVTAAHSDGHLTWERKSSHRRLKARGKLRRAFSLVERSTAPKAALSQSAGTLYVGTDSHYTCQRGFQGDVIAG